jgi:two-component system response regulator RegX3
MGATFHREAGALSKSRSSMHYAVGMTRILVVEDEAVVRHALVRVLTNAGYEVSETPSGPDGLRLYDEQGADLVLTDILMPDMSGTDVIRHLQEVAPRLPVIAMSAGDRTRDLDGLSNASVLGAVSLLRKPFTREELLTVIAAALQKAARGDVDSPMRI